MDDNDRAMWHILMVDDDQDDYVMANRMLADAKQEKYKLQWASSYEAGMHALENSRYDAVLVDYDLGQYTGIEFIQQSFSNGLQAPIILYTGRGSQQVDLEAMRAGATLYLTKGETSALMLERGIRYAIERKQVEQALLASETRYRKLFENSFDGIMMTRPDGTILSANPAACWLLGMSEEEIILAGRDGLVVKDERLKAALLEREKKGHVYTELTMRRKDGSTFIAEVTSVMFRDEDGSPLNSTIIRDITERKIAQVQLQARESELRLIMDAEPALISYIDANYCYRRVNKSYERWFSRPSTELEGRPVWDVLGEPAWQAVKPYMERALEGEQVFYEQELPYAGSGPRWVHVTYTPHRDNEGQVLGFVVHVIDVGEQIRAQAELKRYAEQLQRSNQELSDFAFVASHDLQEPLRKIESFGTLLQESAGSRLDEVENDYLERMQKAAGRMRRLVDSLLSLYQITYEGKPFQEVDLNLVIQDVLDDLQVRIKEKGARVQVGFLPTVQADPVQMHEVFQNLLVNSLKFHKPGQRPAICISSQPLANGNVELRVEDEGIGFDSEKSGRLFTPLHRLRGHSEYEGSGIGLSICKKIVERHGGEITATGQPGVGSSFQITLPVLSIVPRSPDSRKHEEYQESR
jgi:two-component system, LuxR family, sensor kinase FixL